MGTKLNHEWKAISKWHYYSFIGADNHLYLELFITEGRLSLDLNDMKANLYITGSIDWDDDAIIYRQELLHDCSVKDCLTKAYTWRKQFEKETRKKSNETPDYKMIDSLGREWTITIEGKNK